MLAFWVSAVFRFGSLGKKETYRRLHIHNPKPVPSESWLWGVKSLHSFLPSPRDPVVHSLEAKLRPEFNFASAHRISWVKSEVHVTASPTIPGFPLDLLGL